MKPSMPMVEKNIPAYIHICNTRYPTWYKPRTIINFLVYWPARLGRVFQQHPRAWPMLSFAKWVWSLTVSIVPQERNQACLYPEADLGSQKCCKVAIPSLCSPPNHGERISYCNKQSSQKYLFKYKVLIDKLQQISMTIIIINGFLCKYPEERLEMM